MIGQTISHYRIVEKLGEGGMGVVYKAYDTTLKRNVALKFLPAHLTRDEGARKRFIHEAQAAAALDHPNICSVYEIGQSDDRSFIVMPLLEGQSLRDKLTAEALPVEEALDIALQVGRGLAKAHGSGIVHRDIKPGNVLLTEDGRVKIVDFGLAKLGTQTKLTKTGMSVGTVAYMSPEQTRGEGVDHRTDVWSLGVMLYEMLAGKMPFRGDAEPAVVYSILNEDPAPVTSLRREVPVGLEDVVERALSKDVAKRYQTMDEMLSALETVAEESQLGITRRRYAALKRLRRRKRLLAGVVATVVVAVSVVLITTLYRTGQAIERIAVLPFENLSGDPDQDLYSNGITDELIMKLSKISALDVINRRTMMLYKDSGKTMSEIARELDADAVVDGAVLREGDRVRISAYLIHVRTDRSLWSESYDRELHGYLALQNEVAQAIVGAIKVTLTPEEQSRLASFRDVNPAAYEFYRRGRAEVWKFTKEANDKAVVYFQKAIEAEPEYAEAYAMLAAINVEYGWHRDMPREEAVARATEYNDKALALDDQLSAAYHVRASIKFYYEWDWVGADREYRRTLELDPNNAEARGHYAWFLMAMGRFDEAVYQARRGVQLEPLIPRQNWALATVYYYARRYDEAIAQFQVLAELDSTGFFGSGHPFADLLAQMGRYDEALAARKNGLVIGFKIKPESIAALDSAYSESGPKGYWMWHIKSKLYEDRPAYTAMMYAQVGDFDKAFALLEKGYEENSPEIHLLKSRPLLDPLRGDPRYHDLVRRMNFPE